jgi:hypothetical protein
MMGFLLLPLSSLLWERNKMKTQNFDKYAPRNIRAGIFRALKLEMDGKGTSRA